jgi:hypothetical protein
MNEGTMRALRLWSAAVALFGLALCGGAFAGTDAFVAAIYRLVGAGDMAFTPELRFSIGLMGAVSLGWGLSLYAVAASSGDVPGARAPALWRRIARATAAWFVIDSFISVATGFGLNAVSNLFIFGAMLAILWSGGAWGREASPARPLSREGGLG